MLLDLPRSMRTETESGKKVNIRLTRLDDRKGRHYGYMAGKTSVFRIGAHSKPLRLPFWTTARGSPLQIRSLYVWLKERTRIRHPATRSRNPENSALSAFPAFTIFLAFTVFPFFIFRFFT